jgi:thiol-disulfide isomerase/thioredoxin
MNLFESFTAALPLADFLAKYGTDADRQRWTRAGEQSYLTDGQKTLLEKFTRRTNVLVLAGAWCGDCAAQCPIFESFAAMAPVIVTRYLDRDEHADVQAALRINGGHRVPVVVFFSEDGLEVARYGERTLARYRQLAGQPTGPEPLEKQIVQDWLDEFERVQWILRLSPRLRKLHGD